MGTDKAKAKKPKPADDEPRGTIEHLLRESGIEPTPEAIKNFTDWWIQETGKAQARGGEIMKKAREEED